MINIMTVFISFYCKTNDFQQVLTEYGLFCLMYMESKTKKSLHSEKRNCKSVN